VLLTQAGITFEEVMVRFDAFTPGSQFKAALKPLSPTGKVPVLVDGELVVWDTLAIAEYLAEKYPAKHLWPQDLAQRARARSLCAEMHSGFTALRSACPLNIEADLQATGALIWRDNSGVSADVARLITMWRECLTQHGGPLLFGNFSIADAYFAPVCSRLVSYALPLPEDIAAYVQHVMALPSVADWASQARAEQDFLAFEEPYRLQR
jgi:glutathione S-transferase